MIENESQLTFRPKDIELSIFTLWSLFILIDQHFKALVKYRRLLDVDFDFRDEDEVLLDTIYEALVHQIFLKTCAFIDEWDKFLGIKTEKEYINKVKEIKTIAKPLRKFLNSWAGLRDYRNQAIAHNHRDTNGNNVFFMRKSFHLPEGLAEICLMIYCIEKMAKILGAELYEEFQIAITKSFTTGFEYDYSNFKRHTREEIIRIIEDLDARIKKEFKKMSLNVIDVTSDYGDFLKVAP